MVGEADAPQKKEAKKLAAENAIKNFLPEDYVRDGTQILGKLTSTLCDISLKFYAC